MFLQNSSGSDCPQQLEISPHKIISRKRDGSNDVYPLAVSVEPGSYTSLEKHQNEGKLIKTVTFPVSKHHAV